MIGLTVRIETPGERALEFGASFLTVPLVGDTVEVRRDGEPVRFTVKEIVHIPAEAEPFCRPSIRITIC